MMRLIGRISLAWLAGWLAFSQLSVATAQTARRPVRRYQTQSSEPFASPYLNLIRPGADPGFNYFTLVQPQVQQQQNLQLQGRQIQRLGSEVQQAEQGAYGARSKIRATGGGAGFQNYSHYYPGKGGGGGAAPPKRSAGVSSAGGMGIY